MVVKVEQDAIASLEHSIDILHQWASKAEEELRLEAAMHDMVKKVQEAFPDSVHIATLSAQIRKLRMARLKLYVREILNQTE